jgi:hypothetical protein
MTRLVLPHDRRANRTSGLLWCLGATILPSVCIAFAWRPLSSDHVGLLLGAVIAGGFICWTGNNLISGTYTSKQGNYRRDESPIRYWIHTIVVAAATFLVLLFWIHQIRVVTGGSMKPDANRVEVTGLRPSPLPHHRTCGSASGGSNQTTETGREPSP